MNKQGFRKHLTQLTIAELRDELDLVYSKFKNVQQYYSIELAENNSDTKILEQYKTKMRHEFFPRKGGIRNGKVSNLNKWIKEFSQVSVHVTDVGDILILKVEILINFLNEKRKIETLLEKSAVASYKRALEYVIKHDILRDFEERILKINQLYNKNLNGQNLFLACYEENLIKE